MYDHIDKSSDNQARVKWAPNTVVVWDNRITAHVHNEIFSINFMLMLIFMQSAIVDFKESGEARHGARITPQAERPVPALEGLDLSAK